ncbi:MAG: DUF2666 family protein [Candidatus Micrarchaeota archaeon]|nr:DUF2666 family protein [Candidatus Micrarchaeota archaeon]
MPEGDSIEFLAKYKNWLAVKKIHIDEKTAPEEIVLQLSSIRQSVDKKSFELLGIDVAKLDAYATQLVSGKRKSYGSLAEVIQKLSAGDVKEVVNGATGGKPELAEIASTYLFRKTVQGLTFDFDVNPEMLQKAFPNLKVPKPPGRKPKA